MAVGLGKQTVVLTAARFSNYGLMLISPIILVRILSIEQFGEYRQFIVYASFLQLVASFSFSESLLYFIPAHSRSPWRVVAQTNLLTAASSLAVVTGLVLVDFATHRGLVGKDLLPLVAYVLCFVNVDFWEYFFLATHRPVYVFLYSSTRLAGRMALVITAAYISSDVSTIVWSLVAFEAVRLGISSAAWSRLSGHTKEDCAPNILREQLRYCVPAGLGMLLFMANRNMGSVAVAKVLGPVSLAQYTVGTYAEYLYLALGNSIAAVLLPEMVRRNSVAAGAGLRLWQRATVVNCILLLPAAVLLGRYARPVVDTVFGKKYEAAAIVMQIHMLFLIRACLDFSPIIRAVNKTRPLLYSNLMACFVNACALAALLPIAGMRGAVVALVISSYAEAIVLGWFATRIYGVSMSKMIPWRSVGKVAGCAGVAAIAVISPTWTGSSGIVGAVVSSMAYCAVFALLLFMLGVEEAQVLLARLKSGAMSALGQSKR